MVFDSDSGEVLHELTEEGKIEFEKMQIERNKSVVSKIISFFKSAVEK
jgi:hypothetical protein